MNFFTDFFKELYYEYSQLILKNTTDFPFVFLNGPYMDVKTYGRPVCSMNAILVYGTPNKTFRGFYTYLLRIF